MENDKATRKAISDALMPSAVVAGFLIFALYLISQPQSPFPDAWFPSVLAAFAFKVVFSAWIFCEIINSFWSRRNSGASRQDKGSFWVVIGAGFIILFVAFSSRNSWAGTIDASLQYAGLALVVAGIAFREWAIVILGRHFTVHVQIREKAKLVTDGPYRYIRHPSYTGGLLIFIGLTLAVGSFAGVIIGLLVGIVAYEYRIRVEETALQDAFGSEYDEYRKRTWKLFPGY